MNNKLKLILLPLKNSTVYIIGCILIITILVIATTQILAMFPANTGVFKKLNSTELFVQGGSNELDYTNFEPIFPFTESDVELNCNEASIGVEDNMFNAKLGVSDTLQYQMQEKNFDNTVEACPNYTSKQVEQYHLPNAPYNFTNILYGDYPGSGEVLIGEYVANLLVSDRGYDDYKELMGDEINVVVAGLEYERTISGISEGSTVILYNPENSKNYQDTDQPDYYIAFDNKQDKEQFIIDNKLNDKATNIDYYSSDNYNYTDPKVIVILASLSLELLVLAVILFYPLKQIKQIVRFYKHQKSWYYIYTIPLLLTILILLLNIIMYKTFV